MGVTEQQEHKRANRLIHETSPYLLQHAHNPVDWYPWGKEVVYHQYADSQWDSRNATKEVLT